jgi:hypothetical protein
LRPELIAITRKNVAKVRVDPVWCDANENRCIADVIETAKRNPLALPQDYFIANVVISRQDQQSSFRITRGDLQNRIENSDSSSASARLHEQIARELIGEKGRPPLAVLLGNDRTDAFVRNQSLRTGDGFFEQRMSTRQ